MRTIEVFSAGCACCDDTVKAIRAAASNNDNIVLRDMKDPQVMADAKKHGIGRVPAVVIDGRLADCCKSGGVDMNVLRGMGLGA
jgi:glutaredoxin 3